MVIWPGIPDGSILRVHVEPGDYTVEGHGRLQAQNGVTFIDLGTRELVDRALEVPISRGSTFRLLVLLTYLTPQETRGVIRARLTAHDGGPVTNSLGILVEPFEGVYQGQLGGGSSEDELVVMVAGEP